MKFSETLQTIMVAHDMHKNNYITRWRETFEYGTWRNSLRKDKMAVSSIITAEACFHLLTSRLRERRDTSESLIIHHRNSLSGPRRRRAEKSERTISTGDKHSDGHGDATFWDETSGDAGRVTTEKKRGLRAREGEPGQRSTLSVFPRVTDYSTYEPCRMILNSDTHTHTHIRNWVRPLRPSSWPALHAFVIAHNHPLRFSLSLFFCALLFRPYSRPVVHHREKTSESEIDSICASPCNERRFRSDTSEK